MIREANAAARPPVDSGGVMRTPLFLWLAFVLSLSAGCGPGKPAPSGAVYRGKHVSEWGDDLTNPDQHTRLEAAKVLAAMGKEGTRTQHAIPGLEAALKDEDPEVRGWAAVAMMYASKGTPFPVGPLVIPKLKEAAESSDAELRAQATEMVNQMPPPQPAGPPGGNRGEGRGAPPATERSSERAKPSPEEKQPSTEKEKP
jgi:hypothetical protein